MTTGIERLAQDRAILKMLANQEADSLATIASLAGWSKSKAQRAVNRLRRHGLVKIDRAWRPNRAGLLVERKYGEWQLTRRGEEVAKLEGSHQCAENNHQA